MFYIIVVLASFLIVWIFLGIYAGHKLIHPRKHPPNYTFVDEMNQGHIAEEFFKNHKENFTLISEYGYEISGFYFTGTTNKTIVFCHGISWTKYGSAKYLDYFLREGWNIFLYDHRASGDSGGDYPSFGFYEKFDLKSVLEFAKKKFPKTEFIGIFGESLGGAVALQYSKLDPSLQFLIAVCPFTSLKGLFNHHLHLFKIPRILRPFVVFIASLFIRLNANFWIQDIEPEKDALKSQVPLLLYHGKKDKLVPFAMNGNLYEKRKIIAYTEFIPFENDGHTPDIYLNNKSEFQKKMIEFLEKIYSK